MTTYRSKRTVVTGAASGLGELLVERLREDGHNVEEIDLAYGNDVRDRRTMPLEIDPQDIEILINCAGVNKPEWIEGTTPQIFYDNISVNAFGILEMTQWALPGLIKHKGTILNIVSNASHMPMTTSIGYNASKGAAHIMTLQMARELGKKHGITVFGISPNKLAGTGMSRDIEENVLRLRGWDAEYARKYQLAALPAGEETDPDTLAEFIAFLLSEKQRHKFLTGTIIPYGA